VNNLKIFNFENNEVRSVIIDDEPYFIGKDVAEVLGYKDTAQAIKQHVDKEDKLISNYYVSGQNRKMVVVNESGIYSLVFGASKQGKNPDVKENAKKFKRWVTSEVLPSIRKTGGYQVPQDPMQVLELMFQAQKDTKEKVEVIETDVKDLKENVFLSPSQYGYLNKLVGNRVNEVREVYDILSKKQMGELYRCISRDLNDYIGIKTRNQCRIKDFDRATDFVQNWDPSYKDLIKIRELEEIMF
jgi:prophage antirepressor-like protein